MSDTKRIALLVGLVLWAIFALTVSVRAEEFTSPKCGEKMALNIPVQKKMGTSHRVTGSEGGFGGPSGAAGGGTCQESTKQSQASDNGGQWWGGGSGTKIAAPFLVTSAFQLCKLQFKVLRDGSCTQTVTAYIHADNGSKPADAATYTSTTTQDPSTWSDSALRPWEFDNVQLNASTTYWMVLGIASACGGDDFEIRLQWDLGDLDFWTWKSGAWDSGIGVTDSTAVYEAYAYE